MSSPPSLTDYAGVIHLHSAYSFDGRTPVAEIIKAANKSGVDFLLLTDHSTLQARKDGFEGWHDGTLLIVGEEIAPRFNHYLAFQLKESVAVRRRNSRTYLRRPISTACGTEGEWDLSPTRIMKGPHCFT